MKEYLGEEALKVIVSPGRAAYLVPDGDDEALERAVSLASSRWAGVTEPILSVRPDGTVTEADIQIAEALDLVALVNVDCPAGWCRTEFLVLSSRSWAEASWTASIDLRSLPWHVGVTPGTDYVAARTSAPLWERVAAGTDTTNSRHWSAATEDNAGRGALGHRSILDVGLAGFVESEATNARSGPLLLWITEPDSLIDCQTFWNFRALRCLRWPASPLYLLPERALSDWVGLEEVLRQMVRQRQFAGRPDVVINSFSVGDANLKSIGERLGLQTAHCCSRSPEVAGTGCEPAPWDSAQAEA